MRGSSKWGRLFGYDRAGPSRFAYTRSRQPGFSKAGRYLCLRRTNFQPARFSLRIVIFVLHQSLEDEGVERNDHDRQHRRHRDMKEPPDDPQVSECEARDKTERSTPEDADPRVHRDSADDQVDDAPDEQVRDEQLDIETT